MTRSEEVEILPDAEALADRVAEALLDRLSALQAQGKVPAIGLTGGSIADAVHASLARLASGPSTTVDWSRVDVWWGDERYVPEAHEDRNARRARDILLDRVSVEPGRVHEMPATDSGLPDLESAAAAYADDVRRHGGGRFDVLMLGVGPDGHVASLFPGHPALDSGDAVVVAVRASPKPPPERISLTFDALNRATEVWFLVSGQGKAEAVARATTAVDPHEVPAAGVRGLHRTVWWLDEAAASQLP